MSEGPGARLRAAVRSACDAFAGVADERAGRTPAAGGWSAKQVVGHLIDSATINHQRFAQAAARDELVFESYDQDQLVALQGAGDVAWTELLELWRRLNEHLARLMERTPVVALERERRIHNLERIAFRAAIATEPVTLAWFMADYVEHLEHHVRQVAAALAEVPAS